MTAREDIYTKLFSLLQTLGPLGSKDFKTVTREAREVQSFGVGEQPVLIQYEMDEDYSNDPSRPTKRTMSCWLIVGVMTKKGTAGASVLNPLIDKIENLLNPLPGMAFQTLGDTVFSCKIVRVIKDVGDNATSEYRQAAASIELQIISPAV